MTEKNEPDSLAPFGDGGINATDAKAAPSNSDTNVGTMQLEESFPRVPDSADEDNQKAWNSGHPGRATIQDPPE